MAKKTERKRTKSNGSSAEKKQKKTMQVVRVCLLILFLVIVCLGSAFGYRMGSQVFSESPLTSSETAVKYSLTISPSENVLSVGKKLESNGVIESGLVFFIQSKLFQCKLEAGTYEVSSAQSSKEILLYLNQKYVDAHKEEKK